MEKFKLDLTQLTSIAEADRIKGNWYVVADDIRQYGVIHQWNCENNVIHWTGGVGSNWSHWLQIPPNLPGFPKAELPDMLVLKEEEWEYYNTWTSCWEKSKGAKYRRIKHLPELTIPPGTKSEQIEAVKKILQELKTK